MSSLLSTSTPKDMARFIWFRTRKPMLRSLARVGGMGIASEWLSRNAIQTKPVKDGPTVLCIARPHFVKDVEQLKQRTNLNFVIISNGQLESFLRAWVPIEIRKQSFYAAHIDETRFKPIRQRTEAFALGFLKKIQKRTNIDAVMAANIDYWQSDGIYGACVKLGIPFLSLCREHYIVPFDINLMVDRYSSLHYKYPGAGVAVFGESTRQMLLTSGACSSDQIWVTGPPRMDCWREVTAPHLAQRNVITFLSYSPVKGYLAPQNYREVLEVFARASYKAQGGNVRFVVKCKDLADKIHAQKLLADIPDHRLELEEKIPLYELLPVSRLIIGFNSLSVLEGLFSHATLAIPYWADTRRDRSELMIGPADPLIRAAIHFPKSPEELEALIEGAVSQPPAEADRALRMRVLGQYIHFPTDTTCSALVEEFVHHFVAQS